MLAIGMWIVRVCPPGLTVQSHGGGGSYHALIYKTCLPDPQQVIRKEYHTGVAFPGLTEGECWKFGCLLTTYKTASNTLFN